VAIFRKAYLEQQMSLLRAIALFVIVAFGGVVVAAGFMTAPASAGKMDGKPGGRNMANYGATKSAPPKPPTSAKKPPQ
jgi:hypothetical protein